MMSGEYHWALVMESFGAYTWRKSCLEKTETVHKDPLNQEQFVSILEILSEWGSNVEQREKNSGDDRKCEGFIPGQAGVEKRGEGQTEENDRKVPQARLGLK